jgi:PAS domain S-box-containing protein
MFDNNEYVSVDAIRVHSSTTGERHIEVEALLDSIGDGAIMTDEFGRIIRINPAALEILGYTENELLGTWFPKTIVSIGPDKKPLSLIDRPIGKAFLSGKPISENSLYRRKDSSIVPVSLTVAPLMVDDRPVGAIEVFRDITLEHEIDRMKSEFISLASHQLRTPLSAIKTYTHMLLDGFMGPTEPSQRKALKTIISASNRMNELISTLLNITRIESGSIAVTPKTINLARLADEVYREVLHSAQEKQLHMDLKLPKAPVAAKTDTLIAKEVLTNLLTNAIKYTPEGGHIELILRGRPNTAVFVVKDNGFGIPKHTQDQIFTKFFRAQNIVKRETTGTGLGLYLVKGLVDVLGGDVWFESEEDKGSTFYFALPRKALIRQRASKA